MEEVGSSRNDLYNADFERLLHHYNYYLPRIFILRIQFTERLLIIIIIIATMVI